MLWFQLTAARRRLGWRPPYLTGGEQFQLTAARRRLGTMFKGIADTLWFQLTAARRRLALNRVIHIFG